MRGQRTCRAHGGASPQALRCARERLLALTYPAIAALDAAVRQREDLAVATKAATSILDRTGLGPSRAIALAMSEPSRIELHVVDAAELEDAE